MASNASLGEAVLDLTADRSRMMGDLSSAKGALQSSLNNMSSRVSNFAGGALSTFQSLSSKVGQVLKIGLLGAVAGIALLGKSALDAGGDAEEMLSKFNVTFQDFSDGLSTSLEKFGKATGRSHIELLGMSADMGAVFKGMGFGAEEAANLSDQITKLSVDVGSFNNVAAPDVADRFTKALTGEFESLKSLGIVINQTRLKQELATMGVTENINEVDQQTKAQAIMNLLLRSTADAQGDAERTSGSWTNQMVKLRGIIKDTGTKIGLKLIPVLTPLLTKVGALAEEWLPKLAEGFGFVIETLQKFGELGFVEFFTTFEDGSSQLSGFFEKMGMGKMDAQALADKINNLMLSVREFIYNQVIPFVKEHGPALKAALIAIGIALGGFLIISTIAGLIATLTNPLVLVLAVVGLFAAAWTENWGGIRDKLTDAWAVIQPKLAEFWQWLQDLWTKVQTDFIPALKTMAETVGTNLSEAWNKLGKIWVEDIQPAVENLVNFWKEHLQPLLAEIADFLAVTFNVAWEILKDLWVEELQPALEKLWSWLEEKLGPSLETVSAIINDTFGKAISYLSEKFTGLKEGVSGIAGTIDSIKEAIGRLKEMIKNFNLDKLRAIIGQSPSPLAIGVKYARKELQQFVPQLVRLVGVMNSMPTTSTFTNIGGISSMLVGQPQLSTAPIVVSPTQPPSSREVNITIQTDLASMQHIDILARKIRDYIEVRSI